ncbi:MAG: response regulator [Chloroflexi bacterium]|nr:response regulator [Chloroflexota bacterium]
MTRTVLIADDDASLRLLVSTTLADDSLELLEAPDGQQALALARQRRPDLILLDVSMPGLTGLEVCRALKANLPTARVPVVMLTAQGQDSDRERGLAAGAAAYLTKPFSPLQLLHLVEGLLKAERLSNPE